MLKIGRKIDDRYRLNSLLGVGGMAEVYEATDIILKRSVAIKVIRDDLIDKQENVTRFRNEIATCASLDHPNIVHVFNHGEVDGRPYMAYEYISGQTLKQKLDFSTMFTEQEASQIMLQLIDAVSYIHSRNIIHRDIKPQNIFYNTDGFVKVSDFGIATFIDKVGENENGIMGSVHYLAPEISNGEKASIQSDVYAIGVTFFELVTGRLPYEEGEAVDIAVSHINKPFPDPKIYNTDLSDGIVNIILKATQKNLSARYKNCKEMYDDITRFLLTQDSRSAKKRFFSKFFGR